MNIGEQKISDDELRQLSSRADWRASGRRYEQFTSIVNADGPLPDDVAGGLAENLGRVIAHYGGTEEQFAEDLYSLFALVDRERLKDSKAGNFRSLYFDNRLDKNRIYNPSKPEARRRPKPFETAIETCRRLIDLNRVRDALVDLPTAAILGGSVSYGRFFNVQGVVADKKASDMDLLLVIPNYQLLPEIARALKTLQGVDRESVSLLETRASKFESVVRADQPCIFSHKLKLWTDKQAPLLEESGIPGNYKLSLHIFSLEDFDHLILKDHPILEAAADSKFIRRINDYRDEEPTPGRAYDERSFGGIPVGENPLSPRKVDLGYIAGVQVCVIKNDRYCPGLHQNLILPQFEIRWENPKIRLYLRVLSFRWKILERLRAERTSRPFEEQKLSLSHVRFDIFAPHITRRANRE